MLEFFQKLFTSDFMPHGMCFLWNPSVLWLNVISDGLICAAYYAIPVLLFLFFRKRKDIAFRWVFVAFAAFILACGTTHLLGVWTVWHGTYRLDGVVKALTASASVLTAIFLIPLLPALVKLPSPTALQRLNQQLQREIEERRKMAEVLERQASLMDLAHDAIIVRELDGTIQFWNRGAEQTYGWAKDQTLGRVSHDLLATRFPEPLQNIERQLREAGHWEGELIHQTRNASALVVASRWALRESNKPGTFEVLEINRDVTQERKVRQDLHEANQTLEVRVKERTTALEQTAASLERANASLRQEMERSRGLEGQLLQTQKMEAVGRLAGGVAHDFNNLLTVISGYNRMILDDPLHAPDVLEWAGEVRQAADRASSLTSQLLAFSRRQVIQPRIVDLNDIVRNMEKLLRRVIGEDIDLATHLDPALASVQADPGHLEQVIMNLVVNARDAMPAGGKVTVETANVTLQEDYARSHSGVTPGEYVQLAISDTGEGMTEEIQRRIFEPFFTTKEMGKGTGLGLSIVYGIVKQNGGDIWVYTQRGQGTTFKIYLPAVLSGKSDEAKRPDVSTSKRGHETVLLVEDEANVRKLVRAMLKKQGYTILESKDVHDAIQLTRNRQEPIDLLLTDVVMPDLSGPELAEQLMTIHPEMKVLYMSGYADNAIVRHGVLPPGAAFVQKPFTPEALNSKVREVLDRPLPT
jgi:two-component system, cell cycle sensor histidine kinase and response regulator CckA